MSPTVLVYIHLMFFTPFGILYHKIMNINNNCSAFKLNNKNYINYFLVFKCEYVIKTIHFKTIVVVTNVCIKYCVNQI